MACGILFRASDVKDNRVFLALAFAEKHLRLNRAYTILRAGTGTEQRAERTEREELNDLVAECASRTNSKLIHEHLEPGTREAFTGYLACLHQLYLGR